MNKTQQQTKDWQFYKISVVVAGQEPMVGIIDEYINKAIGEMADAGTGLYSNETDVKKEDERLDACLGANALEINRSISFYYNELETRGIVGEGQLFGNTAAEMLFYTFGKMVELLQMDASSPMKMRNDLAEIIKSFDEMPIMGLLYQILLLQGLAFVLERLKVDEGDAGFDEALLLYRWLMKLLGQKEMRFCFMQYGENDLKLLKPFCDFLMSTDMGQCVQSVVFKTNAESEEPQTPLTEDQAAVLPKELDNDKAKALFDKAERSGFISKNGSLYKWNKSKENTYQLLAYFCEKMSRYLNLGRIDKNGNPTTSWRPFERLFGIDNIKGYKNDWLRVYSTFNPVGYERIDALFD